MLFLWCPNEINNNISHPQSLKTWTFYKIMRSLGAYFLILYRLKLYKQNNPADESTTDFTTKIFWFFHR